MTKIKIIECPRDAWQSLGKIIPAEIKAEYLGKLVGAGFRHLDAVSFVSPAHVPQMADSEPVMAKLRDAGLVSGHSNGKSPALAALSTAGNSPEIIAMIVDEEGLERALKTPGVSTLAYPYSISAHFRRQNTNMSLGQSRALVEKIGRAASESGKALAVQISMAFGNPFEEPWAPEIVDEAIAWLKTAGAAAITLADTAGAANPQSIRELLAAVRGTARGIELGVHLHSHPEAAAEKILAASEAGCRRFDSALTGLGGCPFSGDELVVNIATETLITTLAREADPGIDPGQLQAVAGLTREIRARFA